MRLTLVSAPDSASDDLTELYRWLMRDPSLVSGSRMELTGRNPEGKMGATDLIHMVITDGATIGSLVISYLTYRQARPSSSKATLDDGKGNQVPIPEDPGEARRMIEGAIEPEDGAV